MAVTSRTTVEAIAGVEGFGATPYSDPAGNATIGFGHFLHKGPVTAADRQQWGTITRERGFELLAADLKRFELAVNDLVKVPLSQNQFDALVSLAFNVGGENLRTSTLLSKLNAGDYEGAAQEFGRWNKATVNGKVITLKGLTTRRASEAALFRKEGSVIPLTSASAAADDLLTPSSAIGLIAMCSGLALDVHQDSGQGGALVQFPLHGRDNQRFRLDGIDGFPGEVRIINEASGLVLDVPNGDTANGIRVQQWPWHGGAMQRWRFVGKGPNTWQILNVASGKALDVPAGTLERGAQLQQWEPVEGNINQLFLGFHYDDPKAPLPPVPPPVPEPDKPTEVPALDVAASLKAIGFSHGDAEDIAAFQQGWSFKDLAVDGDAGPATIEAIRECLAKQGRVGEFFSWREFRSKGNGRVKTHRQLVRRLDSLRREVGPIPIISGYRDPARNRAVGGATASQHVEATAADIPGVCTQAQAKKHGFSGIGVTRATGRVAHVDVRAEGGRNTTGAKVGAPTVWFYN